MKIIFMAMSFQEMVNGQKPHPKSLSNTKNILETAVLLRDFIQKRRRGRKFVKNIFCEYDGDISKAKSALFELCFAILKKEQLISISKLAFVESDYRMEPHFNQFVSKILENKDLFKNEDVRSMFAMIVNKMYR